MPFETCASDAFAMPALAEYHLQHAPHRAPVTGTAAGPAHLEIPNMPSVRISGNWRSPSQMKWYGAPEISDDGRIDRSIQIPEKAFVAIENAIKTGAPEGDIYTEDGSRFHWFLDQ